MSQSPFVSASNGTDPLPRWQNQLAAVARALPYPPTPNLALAVLPRTVKPVRGVGYQGLGQSTVRRMRYALAAGLILLAALLAVPAVRAGLIEFLQVGVVRIWLGPSPTPTLAPTATGTPLPPTGTPTPIGTPLQSVLDLSGSTTLDAAREMVNYRIALPSYPADLGEPDRVFVQDLDGLSVVMVWLAAGSENEVELSLHVLNSPMMADKLYYDVVKDRPLMVEVTQVNNHDAVWTTGPYVVITRRGTLEERRLVNGHALIWVEGPLTYRLETELSVEEAVRIAESLEAQ
jgi:hypothetical protein